MISQNPGITVSELGRKMKLNHPNYLYRVLPDLEKEGRIKRQGRGYHPG
jgi:DNA-binding HxlR family transcriptional regulator